MATTNGGPADGPNTPSVGVLAQYTKDLSFENPNAPQKALAQHPDIGIEINVNAKPLSESDIEVELTIEVRAKDQDKLLFAVDLAYAGVFRILNFEAETKQQIIMIECPRILFPFARQIIADVTRNGGFPPLLMDPIDFVGLYRQRMAQQQQAAAPK
jgi:preprotein translocase subunit SecB